MAVNRHDRDPAAPPPGKEPGLPAETEARCTAEPIRTLPALAGNRFLGSACVKRRTQGEGDSVT